MKTILTIIIVLFVCSGFGQNNIKRLLKNSFKKADLESLDKFFSNWEDECQPISQNQLKILSDTIQDVYKIFTDLYTPRELNRIGGTQWGDSIYTNVDYFIVQSRIDFAFTETFDKKELFRKYFSNEYFGTEQMTQSENSFLKDTTDFSLGLVLGSLIEYSDKDSIMDFQPNLIFNDIGILYFRPKYTRAISDFLKNKHHKLGFGGIMNPARAKGKSEKRLNWINQKIKVFHGHWGGYWQMTTYPRVTQILFDKKRETAIVFFRMIYEGGEAFYKKIDDKWTLIDAKRTWME
mgnify:CR=1 FL=1